MKEQLISFQLAKLAKEKGFDWRNIEILEVKSKSAFLDSTTQSLLQKWLREIHKIHINVWFKGDMIYDYNSLDWCYEIKSLKENFSMIENRTNFKSFEQALEESLYQALLLI
jgi:uncharacterized protein YabN with tetrapyrrole methylase and pyrophosphatase domain